MVFFAIHGQKFVNPGYSWWAHDADTGLTYLGLVRFPRRNVPRVVSLAGRAPRLPPTGSATAAAVTRLFPGGGGGGQGVGAQKGSLPCPFLLSPLPPLLLHPQPSNPSICACSCQICAPCMWIRVGDDWIWGRWKPVAPPPRHAWLVSFVGQHSVVPTRGALGPV